MKTTPVSGKLFGRLRRRVKGRVLTDMRSRGRVSRDQSIYEIRPLAVACPSDAEDLAEIIRFASDEGLSVTARGGGSGTAGGALGNDVVVVLPRVPEWQKIGELTGGPEKVTVRTAAGVMHTDLQACLKKQGYMLPADVTSAGISQIGGNIATKASGPHALRYGSIDRFVEDVEFFTWRGERVNTADPSTIPTDIRNRLVRLARRILADPEARQGLEARQSLKTSSGYNLFAFLREAAPGRLLAQLLTGSNGTLGLLTGATLRCEPHAADRALMLLRFETLADAARVVAVGRDLGAAAIELMDRNTVHTIVEKTGGLPALKQDGHVVLVEFDGPDSRTRLAAMNRALHSRGLRLADAPLLATEERDMARLWEIRRRILPLLHKPGPGLIAPAIINDIGVLPSRLPDFMEDLEQVLRKHAERTLIYGHAGDGNLHVRPLIDVTRGDLAGRLRRMADEVYAVVFRYGGTVAAEHGTGRLKARYLRREWGDRLFGYMRELKTILDPNGIFNPEVMFSEAAITDHLRSDILSGGQQALGGDGMVHPVGQVNMAGAPTGDVIG